MEPSLGTAWGWNPESLAAGATVLLFVATALGFFFTAMAVRVAADALKLEADPVFIFESAAANEEIEYRYRLVNETQPEFQEKPNIHQFPGLPASTSSPDFPFACVRARNIGRSSAAEVKYAVSVAIQQGTGSALKIAYLKIPALPTDRDVFIRIENGLNSKILLDGPGIASYAVALPDAFNWAAKYFGIQFLSIGKLAVRLSKMSDARRRSARAHWTCGLLAIAGPAYDLSELDPPATP